MFNKDKIEEILNEKGWSKYRLAKEADLGQSTIHEILSGKKKTPNANTLQKMANALEVPITAFFDGDETINVEFIEPNKDALTISKKAERDIQKSLNQTLDMLQNSQDGLMFDGEPLELDDLTRELLIQSLENSMRMAKKIAKEKYTPKKYKK